MTDRIGAYSPASLPPGGMGTGSSASAMSFQASAPVQAPAPPAPPPSAPSPERFGPAWTSFSQLGHQGSQVQSQADAPAKPPPATTAESQLNSSLLKTVVGLANYVAPTAGLAVATFTHTQAEVGEEEADAKAVMRSRREGLSTRRAEKLRPWPWGGPPDAADEDASTSP